MPAGNPFAPLVEVGGGASVGPASGNLHGSFGVQGVGDHHVSAGFVALALVTLILLHKAGKFRFSTTVG